MKSLMVQWGHLACWKALAILHCCFLEDGKYSAVAFMDAFKAVCADSVGCLLPRLLIYCCCIACKLRISSCIAKTQVFASTRVSLRSLITFFHWFLRGWQVLGHHCSAPQFLIFFFLSQLPVSCCECGVPGKPLRLIHGVEQGNVSVMNQ